jgi:photosystem II stability/assembly factor-like uncharacterized protein
MISKFLLFCLLPCSIFCQDGWINQAKVINAGLYDIHSSFNQTGDHKNYWMVGDSGTVLESCGVPLSWAPQESGTEANLRGVYFSPDGTGYCVGDSGTLITSRNYGNSWVPVSLSTTHDLNDIWFINDTAGMIAGDSGTFLISLNDGMTWEAGNLITGHNLNKIRQLTGAVIWIVGDSGTVFKTADGGDNWQNVNTGYNIDFNDVYFADNECIYIAGDQGTVIKTEDSGLTWMDLSVPDTSDLYGVACTNCYNLWVCGDDGSLFFRTAVDTAWIAFEGTTGGVNFHTVHYIPEDFHFVFAADSGSYLYLYNFSAGGYLQKAGEDKDYQVADFVDAQHGFLGGDGILHTVDGGNHWYALHLGDFSACPQIYGMDFTDAQTGWIVGSLNYYGYHSWILKTEDGGLSWAEQYFDNDHGLYCIFFIDHQHGWVGGEDGLILRTDDGGDNWDVIQPGNPELVYVYELYFCNLQDGYMARGYGDFLITGDGGESWQLVNSFTGAFADMFVMNDTIIWLLMNFSGLNKSDDGGSSWTNIPFPYDNHNAHSFFFLDEHEGYACGTGQSLWHTTDGGETWDLNSIGDTWEDYRIVVFADSANGWLLGQYGGSILHGPGFYVGLPENPGADDPELSIFPNPARGKISMKIKDRIPGLPCYITVYNIIGEQMINQDIPDASGIFILDISAFPPGIYLAVTRQGGETKSSGKFIVLAKE